MSETISIVFGEANESDSDEEAIGVSRTGVGLPSFQAPRPVPLRTLSAQPGVVIQGEASETESDDEEDDLSKTKIQRSSSEPDPASTRHAGLPPLKVELSPRVEDIHPLTMRQTTSQNGTLPAEKDIFKFDTLLHRKLRERNASLQTTLYDSVAGAFLVSAKELAEANQMLGKSQSVIQDVSHNLRVFTTDLKQIEQKLDMINSCTNIPDITIKVKQRVENTKN